MDEFSCWMEYLAEPHGDARADWHAAIICQMVHSIGQSFSKRPRRIPTDKFLLKFDRRDREERIRDDAKALTRIFPGVVPEEKIKDFWKVDRQEHEDEADGSHR